MLAPLEGTMAISRCPRSECDGTHFEAKKMEPRNSDYKLMAIQCATCGAVVGVMDWLNIGHVLGMIASKLGIKV